MNPEHREFLNLRRLPATISVEQAVILLGIAEANIPVLVSKGFLRPIGGPLAVNAQRRFCSKEIEQVACNSDEVNRMQQILTKYYRGRNGTAVRRTAGAAKVGRY